MPPKLSTSVNLDTLISSFKDADIGVFTFVLGKLNEKEIASIKSKIDRTIGKLSTDIGKGLYSEQCANKTSEIVVLKGVRRQIQEITMRDGEEDD